ncbi:MAG: hypothetical protein SFW08_05010 [Gemmatimonadaceae bacterium]|nr:hypothetical protein [Gemmatimonadaceae bacterium]
MFNELCDEHEDRHAMQVINRATLAVVVCFLGFGVFAVSTRMGADAPPTSVAYGTEAPHPTSAVLGD